MLHFKFRNPICWLLFSNVSITNACQFFSSTWIRLWLMTILCVLANDRTRSKDSHLNTVSRGPIYIATGRIPHKVHFLTLHYIWCCCNRLSYFYLVWVLSEKLGSQSLCQMFELHMMTPNGRDVCMLLQRNQCESTEYISHVKSLLFLALVIGS